jgi:hypothetical protein
VGSSLLSALRTVRDPAQVRARVVSAKNGDFVTELDVLGGVGAGE